MAHSTARFRLQRRQLVLLVLLVIVLYALVPQFGSFRHSFQVMRQAAWRPLLLALSLNGASYLAAAGTYCWLAFHRLAYGRTVLLQLASMFANRILPAGSGAVGVNYLYLRRSGHNAAEAAAVVAANNLLGLVGHLLAFGGLLVLFHEHIPAMQHTTHSRWLSLGLVSCGLALLAALCIPAWRQRVRRVLGSVVHQLRRYAGRPFTLLAATGTSMLVTLTTVGSFYWALAAVGVHLSFVVVMIVFSIGLSLGTATPTPGGLGGQEAGLVSGLLAYHVPAATALAGVLLFRLISYWLSIAVGAGAFAVVQRRQMIKF